MAKAINIHAFAKRFGEIYDTLYHSVSAYDRLLEEKACETFDRMMKTNKAFCDFVNEYVAFRQDFISSDREAAAFILTLDEMANS